MVYCIINDQIIIYFPILDFIHIFVLLCVLYMSRCCHINWVSRGKIQISPTVDTQIWPWGTTSVAFSWSEIELNLFSLDPRVEPESAVGMPMISWNMIKKTCIVEFKENWMSELVRWGLKEFVALVGARTGPLVSRSSQRQHVRHSFSGLVDFLYPPSLSGTMNIFHGQYTYLI